MRHSNQLRSNDSQNGPFDQWLIEQSQCFQTYFEQVLPQSDTAPSNLHEVMRYAALNGGKRLRPALIYACGETLCDPRILDELAVVVESVHVYSLIHDDLPSMDNDSLRRGKPTCHINFGEGMAILAGDALLTWAFERLSRLSVAPERLMHIIQILATAIGPQGMAEGQAIDISSSNDRDYVLSDLETMHYKKTGLLIQSSLLMPLYASGKEQWVEPMKLFGQEIGIAFQIQDDILEQTVDTQQLGKSVNSDTNNNKLTYPSLLGLEASYEQRDYYLNSALARLDGIKWDYSRLADLARYMVTRTC